MKWYVDFDGWAVVEAETAEEAVEKFYRDEYIDMTYGDVINVEECSDEQSEQLKESEGNKNESKGSLYCRAFHRD